MNRTFNELGIHSELVDELQQEGLFQPTPVQERAIPIVLAGHDVIVQAQTGTGKTLAFVLPILQKMDPDAPFVQALVVTPTRELAIQITGEVKKLKDAVGATVLAAYGGQDVTAQIYKLKDAPNIVIGTPGRLLDHLRRGTVRFDRLTMLVLDEADQMLHMGFLTEVEEILSHTPSDRQTMLFSATMPDNVRRLASRYMNRPEDIRVQGKRITVEGIRQVVIETSDRDKQQTLLTMIEQHRPYLAVVFCRTKIRAKKLTEALQAHGVNADELHGDLSQAKREQVMKRFRDAKLQILVATDVAARGLDVEGVTHVFNYDIPHDAESYIHRIGRTARAGQKGTAFTFAAPRDSAFLDDIEREIGGKLERRRTEGRGEHDGEARHERSRDAAKSAMRNAAEARGAARGESGRGAQRTGARGKAQVRGEGVRGTQRSVARGAASTRAEGGRVEQRGTAPAWGENGRGAQRTGARGKAQMRGESGREAATGAAPAWSESIRGAQRSAAPARGESGRGVQRSATPARGEGGRGAQRSAAPARGESGRGAPASGRAAQPNSGQQQRARSNREKDGGEWFNNQREAGKPRRNGPSKRGR